MTKHPKSKANCLVRALCIEWQRGRRTWPLTWRSLVKQHSTYITSILSSSSPDSQHYKAVERYARVLEHFEKATPERKQELVLRVTSKMYHHIFDEKGRER